MFDTLCTLFVCQHINSGKRTSFSSDLVDLSKLNILIVVLVTIGKRLLNARAVVRKKKKNI